MDNVTIANVKDAFKKAKLNLDIDALAADVTFRDQGVDSLDVSNLFLHVEEDFNVIVPDEDIDALNTIEKIVSYINSKKSA